MAELESPSSPDELYRYRGNEVPLARPIFQGDIFRDVEIPGLDDGPGLAMVTTHACTMRSGTTIQSTPRTQPINLPWSGNFRVMPLPELLAATQPGQWVMTFEDVGVVRTDSLDLRCRVACLDDRGVVLLQQRQAHHFTRYAVEATVLYEQSASVLAEAELLETWVDAALSKGDPSWSEQQIRESEEFDTYLSPMREELKDPPRRAAVRRAVGQEVHRRFG